MLSRERTDEARLRALLEDVVEDPDERELGALLRELRTQAPAAPTALRERVRTLDDSEPSRSAPRSRPSLRRTALALAAVLVLVTLVGGMIRSANMGGGDESAADADGASGECATCGAGGGQAAEEPVERDFSRAGEGDGEAATALGGDPEDPATLPPSRRRAQDYRAYLRLHVEDNADLSRKTKEALSLTRSYGGYVVSVDYDSADEGMASLELRVPIRRIQDAIVEYSELGPILGQNVQIVDLQRRINARSRSIQALRERIAEIRSALRGDDLDATEREQLEAELAERRARVEELRRERSGVRTRASMARVTLELTTMDEEASPAPGGLEGTLRGAGEILLMELRIVLYALIVGAPLLLLGVLAFLGVRLTRRRADERLLERA